MFNQLFRLLYITIHFPEYIFTWFFSIPFVWNIQQVFVCFRFSDFTIATVEFILVF